LAKSSLKNQEPRKSKTNMPTPAMSLKKIWTKRNMQMGSSLIEESQIVCVASFSLLSLEQ